jgi:hypothetical protein
MAKLFNRARMTVTSTGTGTLTLGTNVALYQTFASAGVSNGDVVSYTIEDGLNWEIGTGTYTSSGTTLSRTVTQSYNGTTYGTSAISVTTSAQVFVTALAVDLQSGTAAGNLVALDNSAKIPAVDGSLLTNVTTSAARITGLAASATTDTTNASNITSGTLSNSRLSGVLLASNNLSDVTASTARTNLGLGSAATLTAGTSANNLVQLDGSAKLPAVDGSQLTGISAGATGGGTDKVFWNNGQTITTNYTVPVTTNAGTFGPVTINSSITVTVSSGSNWIIV